MGSRVGYEYRYHFSKVDEDEINSLYISDMKLKPGFFEIRTDFIIEIRLQGVAADAIMDSETFDARIFSRGHEREDFTYLYFMTRYSLFDYWMTGDEMNVFVKEAVAFAKQTAAKPEHASLNVIPVVVDFKVRTVQQEGESFVVAMDRAIRAQNLVPLYLWPQPRVVKSEPMTGMLLNFLKGLERIRVEDVGKGLALMQVCYFCGRKPNVGAQISPLPCNHAFHSYRIVRLLEDNNLCPLCRVPAYPDWFVLSVSSLTF